MRTLVILLILANLTLLGYTWLDRRSSGEGARLAEQVKPERIRLLTPQEVAQLGPAKMAALPDVCVEWGPFADADRARALADLEPLALGRLLTQRRAEVGARQQTVMMTTLVIRDPREPVISRLRELAPSYPGTEAKVGSCEKGG